MDRFFLRFTLMGSASPMTRRVAEVLAGISKDLGFAYRAAEPDQATREDDHGGLTHGTELAIDHAPLERVR